MADDKKFTPAEHVMYATMVFGSILGVIFGISAAIAWSLTLLLTSGICVAAVIGAVIVRFTTWPDDEEPVQDTPIPDRVNVDADYFMPFCVCPECDVEALHWMSEPDTAEATATIARFEKRVDEYIKDEDEHWARTARTGRIETYWRRERPKETLAVKMARQILAGRIHVIRTCREPECKHEWAQRIWSPDADAE